MKFLENLSTLMYNILFWSFSTVSSVFEFFFFAHRGLYKWFVDLKKKKIVSDGNILGELSECNSINFNLINLGFKNLIKFKTFKNINLNF